MTTRLVEVTRGGVVESVHQGTVVVADSTGKVIAHAGDPDTFAYFRSSAKPFQAVPMVESGAADAFGFTPAELALCCASHSAEAMHQTQVLAMLAKIGLDDGALQCGIPLPIDETETALILSGQKARSPLQCDCSGKHTGMLAACVQLGYPIEIYLEPEHPLQQRIKSVVAAISGVPEGDLKMATDGCSVPTFGMPIAAMARSFATLAAPEATPAGTEHAAALNRLRAAMNAHPENVGGTHGRVDTDLMRIAGNGIAAKSGAEGLLCVAIPAQGIGIAIRMADGSHRGHAVVVEKVLSDMNLIGSRALAEFHDLNDPRLFNHNKRLVGELRTAFTLTTV